jgi:hypothetical protein
MLSEINQSQKDSTTTFSAECRFKEIKVEGSQLWEGGEKEK